MPNIIYDYEIYRWKNGRRKAESWETNTLTLECIIIMKQGTSSNKKCRCQIHKCSVSSYLPVSLMLCVGNLNISCIVLNWINNNNIDEKRSTIEFRMYVNRIFVQTIVHKMFKNIFEEVVKCTNDCNNELQWYDLYTCKNMSCLINQAW